MTIFENAAVREQLAQKMYIELGDKADSQELKSLFYKIAEEEILHERLFKKMDIEVLKKVNQGILKDLNLIKDAKRISSDDIKEIHKVLDFAIAEEQRAYEDYSRLMVHLDFGDARE